MNLDSPCHNCGQARGKHWGQTYQGACPADAALRPGISYVKRSWRPTPRLLHGGGPWAISPDCRVKWHNTGAAAKGSLKDGRCECPRAVELREADLQKRKDERAIAAIAAGRVPARGRPTGETKAPDSSPVFETAMPRPTDVRSPNFRGAACLQPWAQEIVDRSFSLYGGTGGIERREEMRVKVCGVCPFIRDCAAWVLAAETPAGSWGGMYGGLDVWNRAGHELYIGVDGIQMREFSPRAYLAGL